MKHYNCRHSVLWGKRICLDTRKCTHRPVSHLYFCFIRVHVVELHYQRDFLMFKNNINITTIYMPISAATRFSHDPTNSSDNEPLIECTFRYMNIYIFLIKFMFELSIWCTFCALKSWPKRHLQESRALFLTLNTSHTKKKKI